MAVASSVAFCVSIEEMHNEFIFPLKLVHQQSAVEDLALPLLLVIQVGFLQVFLHPLEIFQHPEAYL